MNNLQHLYETDPAFADIVDEAAAAAIGSTSASFAGEWLKLECEHVETANPPSERLSAASDAKTGAPAPTVDSRAALEADVRAWLGSWTAFSVPLGTVEGAVLGWLDRQAAITAGANEELITMQVEAIARLQAENDALLAAHADDVERLDAMGEGELMRKLDELQEEVEEMQDELKRVWKESEKWKARCAELQAERDSFEHDLSETEAEFAKETAETLSLHSKQQAASHQAWVDAVDERDYWKQEVQYCMDAAYPPSHAPERPYNPHVMDYPRNDGYTTPATLVASEIDHLRDFHADDQRLIAELEAEVGELRDDARKYRELAGDLLDAAQNMQRIADRGLE